EPRPQSLRAVGATEIFLLKGPKVVKVTIHGRMLVVAVMGVDQVSSQLTGSVSSHWRIVWADMLDLKPWNGRDSLDPVHLHVSNTTRLRRGCQHTRKNRLPALSRRLFRHARTLPAGALGPHQGSSASSSRSSVSMSSASAQSKNPTRYAMGSNFRKTREASKVR